jgi:hypothetical protein
LVMPPSRVFPPVEFCRGTKPGGRGRSKKFKTVVPMAVERSTFAKCDNSRQVRQRFQVISRRNGVHQRVAGWHWYAASAVVVHAGPLPQRDFQVARDAPFDAECGAAPLMSGTHLRSPPETAVASKCLSLISRPHPRGLPIV